ncbi:MAG: galactose mutarotase [Clostridiales bacterium]|jgi:aldose 1-epimerase|nr:galactose mutarotase [Clostridiales bacterium]
MKNINHKIINNVDTIVMSIGAYEAVIVPSIGGNIFSFRNTKLNIDILNSAPNMDIFKEYIMCFGIPALMPPSRVEDGKYSFEGIDYVAPINDKQNNCWIHGLVTRKEWTLDNVEEDDESALVTVSYTHNESRQEYSYYPFSFKYETKYLLTKEGLQHTATITNLGKTNMPLSLGYHTTFALPIGESGNVEDVKLRLAVKERWIEKENGIPTGEVAKLDSDEELFITNGINPLYKNLDHLYKVGKINFNGEQKNVAILEDTVQNIKIVYEPGDMFQFWVLWNCEKNGNFVSLEPQTSTVNVFNAKDKVKGNFIILEPHVDFIATSKIYVI